jgi:tripartite-type tricarboxylate transporter receptor subunit TctC
MQTIIRALGVALALVATPAAIAQRPSPEAVARWPDKPVRFIAPYAAGGTTDILARAMAQKLTEAFGQSFIVDNRPGAGGNIGSELVAKAPPDGYSLLLAPISPLAINVSLYGRKLPFNPEKDFAPITLVAKVPLVIVVQGSSPHRTLMDLVNAAKASPGKLVYGSSGNGSSNHLTGELLKANAKIDMIHIPFKGGAPGLVSLMSGQLDMMVAQVPSVQAMHRSGRVRVLAVSGAKRSPGLPDVPTIIKAGVPDMDATSWYSVVTTAGTPKPIVDRLHAALMKILRSPEIQDRLLAEGAAVEPTTPDELRRFIRAEIEKWAIAVRFSGAKLD